LNTSLPFLLDWLQLYGYPALWGCIFIAAIGAPLPISLLLLAAGAFAAPGEFNIGLLTLIASSSAICGDCVGYLLGRWVGKQVLNWFTQQRRFGFISPQVVQRAQVYFHRRGVWAIFLSRFLVSALGGPINILAGADSYPFRRFLIADISGEAINTLLPLTLGFVFGASWEAIGGLLTTISALIVAMLIAIYLLIRLIKTLKKERNIKTSSDRQKLEPVPIPIKFTRKRLDSLPLSEGLKRIK
jgi:membrane-associated protein